MKRIATVIYLFVFATAMALFSFGCESSNSETCKVVSFKTYNLIYDELSFNAANAFNPNFVPKMDLTYENNRIIQVKGGLNVPPPGQFLTNFFMDNDVVEQISYEGNTTTVNSPHLYSKDFIIANDRLVSQKTAYSAGIDYSKWRSMCTDLMAYEYDNDIILEMAAGQIRRKFYMSAGNLVKVELFIRNGTTNLKKIEYVFSQYDNTINLLKGKFYINGKFFNAFSENNYRRIDIKFYNFVDNAYQYDSNQGGWTDYGEAPVDLFTKECQ